MPGDIISFNLISFYQKLFSQIFMVRIKNTFNFDVKRSPWSILDRFQTLELMTILRTYDRGNFKSFWETVKFIFLNYSSSIRQRGGVKGRRTNGLSVRYMFSFSLLEWIDKISPNTHVMLSNTLNFICDISIISYVTYQKLNCNIFNI